MGISTSSESKIEAFQNNTINQQQVLSSTEEDFPSPPPPLVMDYKEFEENISRGKTEVNESFISSRNQFDKFTKNINVNEAKSGAYYPVLSYPNQKMTSTPRESVRLTNYQVSTHLNQNQVSEQEYKRMLREKEQFLKNDNNDQHKGEYVNKKPMKVLEKKIDLTNHSDSNKVTNKKYIITQQEIVFYL